VAGGVCGTLRQVARRRSTAPLPSYRAVPTRERVEATRRDIIAAAVHAFRLQGYAATQISTVAAIAGVSPRTLYRYFGSKSELFAATVEESTENFLKQVSERISSFPLRDAIIDGVKSADIELNGENREMMRLAAADEKAWRYFLGATNRLQATLATALRVAAERAEGPEHSDDEALLWDVRAAALLGAITTAYRRWATTPGSELPSVIATAVDAVMPVVTARTRYSPAVGVLPVAPIQD
jgi:AcrR family transcriptional regulator